jgi:hypothetical protein
LSGLPLVLVQFPLRNRAIPKMLTRAKTNIIRHTMAAMVRGNIARSPGLAKYLIDRALLTAGNRAQNHPGMMEQSIP